MNPLIALAGIAKSGKSTVADLLEAELYDRHKLDYLQFAFAEPLKKAVAGLTGCKVSSLDDQKFKASESTIRRPDGGYYSWRQVMQGVGDALRSINPDIFVDKLFDATEAGDYTLITDARLPNEFEAIKARGGIIILIVRPGLDSTDTHNSENGWRDWDFDYTLHNDGTLDSLHKKVKTLVAELATRTEASVII